MKTGVELIAEERKRHIKVKGYTANFDAGHTQDELAILAMLYACPSRCRATLSPRSWFKAINWNFSWWNPVPNNRIRELQKAGALIAAEIDRIQRKQQNEG